MNMKAAPEKTPATRRLANGRVVEVIRRYRDPRGQVWIVYKDPIPVSRRTGNTDPEAFLQVHCPDPDAAQPAPAANIELEV